MNNIIYKPFNLSPLGSQSLDSTESQIFSWTYKNTDSTKTLSSHYIEYRENVLNSPLNNTGWVNSTNPQHTFNANVFTNGKVYGWRVKLKDSGGLESEFSDWVLFKTSKKPTCSIVYPSADNDIIENEIPTLQHSYQDAEGLPQKQYYYRIFADDGTTLLWQSDILIDTNNLTVPPKGLLQNSTYYKVDVTVEDSDSLSATSIKRRFYTNFPPTLSNSPDFTITTNDQNARAELKWINIKSKVANYSGSGQRYVPAKFNNGIEIAEATENLVKTNANATADFSNSTGWTLSSGATIANGVLTLQSPDGFTMVNAKCTLTNLTQYELYSFLMSARYKDSTGTAKSLYLDLYGNGYDSTEQELLIGTGELSTSFKSFIKNGFNSQNVPTSVQLRIQTSSSRPIEIDFVQLEKKSHATSFTNNSRLADKVYWDIEIPEIVGLKNIFIPKSSYIGTLECRYLDDKNYLKFYYDNVGQKFVVEKSVNGYIRYIGSPSVIPTVGQPIIYFLKQTVDGTIVYTKVNGITTKWGDL